MSLYWIKVFDFFWRVTVTATSLEDTRKNTAAAAAAPDNIPLMIMLVASIRCQNAVWLQVCVDDGPMIWGRPRRGKALGGRPFLCTPTTNARRLRRLMCKTQEKLLLRASSLSTLAGWCSYLWLIVTDCLHCSDCLGTALHCTALHSIHIEFHRLNLSCKTSFL